MRCIYSAPEDRLNAKPKHWRCKSTYTNHHSVTRSSQGTQHRHEELPIHHSFLSKNKNPDILECEPLNSKLDARCPDVSLALAHPSSNCLWLFDRPLMPKGKCWTYISWHDLPLKVTKPQTVLFQQRRSNLLFLRQPRGPGHLESSNPSNRFIYCKAPPSLVYLHTNPAVLWYHCKLHIIIHLQAPDLIA